MDGDGEAVVLADAAAEAPPLGPYAESLPLLLLRAREAVMRRLRPILRDHGVTEQQWRVLRTLAAVPELEVGQLAAAVFLLPSSLSRILRYLAARDLIRRRASDADLRRGLVSISEAGLRLIAETAPAAARANAEIERLYGGARHARLKRALLELEAALERPAP